VRVRVRGPTFLNVTALGIHHKVAIERRLRCGIKNEAGAAILFFADARAARTFVIRYFEARFPGNRRAAEVRCATSRENFGRLPGSIDFSAVSVSRQEARAGGRQRGKERDEAWVVVPETIVANWLIGVSRVLSEHYATCIAVV